VGPQRWVRYGNDVVLVNIRTGRVIEVHRAFFW
jgi:Ni/Co efflux regulator RcnB